MPKVFYSIIPTGYPVCLHADCPKANTCLHQLAYAPTQQEQEVLRVLNPGRCTKDEDCKYYRSNAPIRYARGFASFKPKMLPGQWSAFVNILRNEWGRTRFYERRRGDIPMPPSEQDFVLEALKKSGVTDTFDFDQYEDMSLWND